MANDDDLSRREFLNLSALAGSSLRLTNSMNLFAGTSPATNIQSGGCAAIDTSGKLVPWKF
jgi:uncharacterized zinc-type alcohol dehydrogenase-like protein